LSSTFSLQCNPESLVKTAGKFPRPLQTQTYSFSDQPFCRIADQGEFIRFLSIAKLAF